MMNKFPLVAVLVSEKKKFIVTAINFDTQQVFKTNNQMGSGEWYDFDEVYLMENKNCDLSFEDLILNSDTNYSNYDLIDGERTIYDNEYHSEPDINRLEQIKLESENKIIKDHNDYCNRQIDRYKSMIIK